MLTAAVAALGGPRLATWQAAAAPWWAQLGLVVLMLLAWRRPGWAPAILLTVVPLVPVLPTLVTEVPAALVHLWF